MMTYLLWSSKVNCKYDSMCELNQVNEVIHIQKRAFNYMPKGASYTNVSTVLCILRAHPRQLLLTDTILSCLSFHGVINSKPAVVFVTDTLKVRSNANIINQN